MKTSSLRTLITTRVDEFFEQLAGVRDGDPEAIHQARVACRRLRELLPLVDDDRAREAELVVRTAGRQLGRVRDLDVMAELLLRYEQMQPVGAAAIAVARREIRGEARDERRALVKSLERLELSLVAGMRSKAQRLADAAAWVGVIGDWTPLQQRIGERAGRLREAVDHASGVYFPNRLHGTRIAVKQLRYVVELAEQARIWNPPHLLGDLRKAQATLGDIHDLQVLIERIGRLAGNTTAGDVAPVQHALDVDIVRLHRRYLDRRERLLHAADACDAFAARRRVRTPAVGRLAGASVAMAIAAPVIWRRLSAASGGGASLIRLAART